MRTVLTDNPRNLTILYWLRTLASKTLQPALSSTLSQRAGKGFNGFEISAKWRKSSNHCREFFCITWLSNHNTLVKPSCWKLNRSSWKHQLPECEKISKRKKMKKACTFGFCFQTGLPKNRPRGEVCPFCRLLNVWRKEVGLRRLQLTKVRRQLVDLQVGDGSE